tara:strand:+ start:30315 stop:33281 length:2967 start_codon:yes stop_codon:yes gene_type:complete
LRSSIHFLVCRLFALGLCFALPFHIACSPPATCQDERVSSQTLDPNGSPCEKDCECNNQRYTGKCESGTCKALKRGACDDQGKKQTCIPKADCQTGTQICQPSYLTSLYWGDCEPDKDCTRTYCTPGDVQPCYEGKPEKKGIGLCKEGEKFCGTDKTWGECKGWVAPTAEECNNEDDDCDGLTDEDTERSCYTGPNGTSGEGACQNGTQICQDGKWLACKEDVTPKKEVCNGKDDDCDGEVDESFDGAGAECGVTGGQGLCSKGTFTCAKGQRQCVANIAKPEECNNEDDDCDGKIDNQKGTDTAITRACYSGPANTKNVGHCKSGTQTCEGGQWKSCTEETLPQEELCIGQDHDCDGQVDEQCTACAPTKLSQRLTHPARDVFSVAYHPTLDLFASGSQDGKIRVWRKSDHGFLTRMTSGKDEINALAFHPTKRILASLSEKGTLSLWNLDPNKLSNPPLFKEITSTNAGRALAFLPGGQHLAASYNKGKLTIWDISTPTRPIETYTYKSTQSPFYNYTSLAVAPSGKYIAVATSDPKGAIEVFEETSAGKYRTYKTLSDHTGPVRDVAFSPDGKTLVSVSNDNSVLLWNTTTWTSSLLGKHSNEVSNVAFHPGGKEVMTAGIAGKIKIWSLSSKMNLSTTNASLGHIGDMAFRTDGKQVVLTSHSFAPRIKFWAYNNATLTNPKESGHSFSISSMAHHPTDPIIAITSNMHVVLINTKTGKRIESPQQHKGLVSAMAFHPDGSLLVTGALSNSAVQKELKFWDARTLQPKATSFNQSFQADTLSIAFSADGAFMAASFTGGLVKVWNASDNWKVPQDITNHTKSVVKLAFHPTERILMTASEDQSIRFWSHNGTQFTETKSIQLPEEPTSLALHPSGKEIAVGLFSDKVEIWDIKTYTKRATLSFNDSNHFISMVSYAKKSYVFSASVDDGEIRFWDSRTYQALSKSVQLHHATSNVYASTATWSPLSNTFMISDEFGFTHLFTCP